ncbi:Molybdopterin oxidoreductase [Desulfonema magnum]|uniref:Molybdopterin oxidoreductase n=3 Tax=Desulfonema magnum TaxID=45655 RepID=A0A975BF04_9BACT|nr:Molybdopterin oxidoreductase [Desulfonema magnum]
MSDNMFVLNGREVSFDPGQTILEAAEACGVQIPTLCHLKGTTPTGECRICVVEVQGADMLVTSCSTPVEAGMQVKTESPRVVTERKKILEQLLTSGNHNCAISGSDNGNWTEFQLQVQKNDASSELCPVWGDCKLQELAYQYQVKITPSSPQRDYYPSEMANPMIIRDFSRCILCGRCIKACNEVQVNRAISMGYEGDKAKVVTPGDHPLSESDCVFCGECVQACPVGALVEKKARHIWRPWETEKIRTTCPYCGVGCQQLLHVKDGKIVKVTGVEDAEPNQGRLCVKGRFGYDFIYSKDRLKTPLIRENNEFREASWDEALDLVARKFKEIIRENGPDAIAGVSCARSINEDSYQMQKLFRAVIGTNNIDHCART